MVFSNGCEFYSLSDGLEREGKKKNDDDDDDDDGRQADNEDSEETSFFFLFFFGHSPNFLPGGGENLQIWDYDWISLIPHKRSSSSLSSHVV